MPDLAITVSPKMTASVMGRLRYAVVEVASCFFVINFEKKIGARIDLTKKLSPARKIKLRDKGLWPMPNKSNTAETADD